MPTTPNAENLFEEIKKLGITTFQNWLSENEILLEGPSRQNFFEKLEENIQNKKITLKQIEQGIAEMEENGDKKICLLQILNIDGFNKELQIALSRIKRKSGYSLSTENWIREKANLGPTFIYMIRTEDELKIKFSEQHSIVEFDPDSAQFISLPKVVTIVFVIGLQDGLVQIRFDSPGNKHTHKNSEGKSSESAYEDFYKNLLAELFPDANFVNYNLSGIANYIEKHEYDSFRITKGVTTITNAAKQTFSGVSTKLDVRDLPEYKAAAATTFSDTWLTEDLTGYWKASTSDEELIRDLFMRVSRRSSQIRVQRGCLEKELNYGINKIREIQEKISGI